MQKHRRIIHNILLYSIFALYIVILFAILFMNRRSYVSVSLVPFRTISSYLSGGGIFLRGFAFVNVLGNIVMFVPLGIYLTLFNRDKRILVNAFWVFLISLSAEIAQYVFRIGASDIDDVILNCLGGFIGIAVYRLLLLSFKDTDRVKGIVEIIALIGAAVSFIALHFYNI